MKKMQVLFSAIVAVAFLGTAWASDYDANIIDNFGASSGHNLTSVRDEGNDVIITLSNVRSAPIGRDTKGADLQSASTVQLYSGIMDAAGVDAPFVVAPVVSGTATFRIPNTARRAGVPVVEHVWGRANNGKAALVHDPMDPWVCYKQASGGGPDLQTLAIGIVMYPDRPTAPLMSLGQGKLDQGKHPELQ